ncbi:MAG: 1-deoxy-D-xylulose-5-phosphate synthase, partial [Ruminococcus sp.]|nr:1-deoxy-D-xylulose-5-phosphate synthase [Ruminococcus sp.]
GVSACILKLCRVKPVDPEAVEFAKGFDRIFFFEEGMLSGSVAENFRMLLDEQAYSGSYRVRAINDKYIHHASVAATLSHLGLDAQGMVEVIGEDS